MQHRPDAPYIFISYASADRARVLPLVDALARAGVAVWIDREGIHGGANYGREIAEAIKDAAAFVLMASSLSLASRNVKQEIAVAWEYERAYLPLLLEAVAIPDDVKYWLTAAQWVEVLDTPEQEWLPPVLAALAPFGVAPKAAEREGIRLAGRERELVLLRERLAAAKEGKGGLVLLGGEAGIGKTTLAEAALREAASAGFAVLEGHCFDLAETPPYGPFIDLFLRLPQSPGMPPLPEAFATRGTVGAVPTEMALIAQVLDFLTALGTQRPVALLLDDLHWSDPASLDLLRFLARSVVAMPLLILVTYRSDELTRRHPLYQLLPQLAREAGAARIDLGRLDDDAVRTLVAERYALPDADMERLVDYLWQRAQGNALYVGELLRALEEAGTVARDGDGWRLGDLTKAALPVLLRQVIEGRVARLDDAVQHLLGVAAVVGQEVPLETWAAVADVDEDALAVAVERATEAHLMEETPDGTRARFAHALVREALYDGILPSRRRRLHRTTAEAMEQLPAPDFDALAYHYQQAGDERAARWLVVAGVRAENVGALLTAAARYEAALHLLEARGGYDAERGWLLLHLGRAHRYRDQRVSLRYLDEAVRVAATVGDAALDAEIWSYHGLARANRGEIRAGLEEMMRADRMRESVRMEQRPWMRGRPSPPTASGEITFRVFPVGTGGGVRVMFLALAGRVAEACQLGEGILARWEEDATLGTARDVVIVADTQVGLAHAYATLGRPEEAQAALQEARAQYTAWNPWMVYNTLARELRLVLVPYETERVNERQQRVAELQRAWERALETRPDWPDSLVRWQVFRVDEQWPLIDAIPASVSLMVRSPLATFAYWQGNGAIAKTVVREALPDGPATEPGDAGFLDAIGLQRLAATMALDDGDPSSARAWLEAHDRWLAWSGAVLGRAEGAALWAQYHRQAGDMDKARDLAERALAHATEPRQPLALLAAHRLLGELDTETGRYDDAARHLDASLALATACQAPYERALTLLAMAELHAITGDTDGARTLLAEVTAICGPLGAKPALARADVLAARLTIT